MRHHRASRHWLRCWQFTLLLAIACFSHVSYAQDDPDRVHLPRELGTWDYAATAAALGLFYAVEFSLDEPRGAGWTEPLPLLDGPVRDQLVFRTRAARDAANRWSDYFWFGTIGYSVLAPAAAALASPQDIESRWAMLWRMEMINVQAYAIGSLLTRIPHKLIGRTRPGVIGCESDPNYSDLCGQYHQFASFPGGHMTITTTGAGLACAHHLHGHLFGGIADQVGCTLAVAGATVVFATRLQADRHWASDNIVGALFGFVSGYLIPVGFYYDPFWADDKPKPSAALPSWTVVPEVGESFGAQVVGQF